MKRVSLILLGLSVVVITSCKKNNCHECHYEDDAGQEVELGEKCGDELEDLEANGITVDGTKREVHCHEH